METPSLAKARAAWASIGALGGHGVWDDDMVVVSLDGTAITDEDLSLFEDFPGVQILNLSHTAIGDAGLAHLNGVPALEELILVDTRVSVGAIERFREAHPGVKIATQPVPNGRINPFTGQPF